MGIYDSLIEDGCSLLKEFINKIFDWYNVLTGMAVELLGQSPASWNADGWRLVETVNSVFIGIGSALVVIFFLIGFCSDSLDIRQDFRIENILRMFIKLSLAEFFVGNSLKLIKNFFSLATGIISKLSGKSTTCQFSIPDKVNAILKNPTDNDIGFMALMMLFLMSVIFLFIICGCGILILYLAYIRFFKIMMLIPYGSLANSTIAGNHMLSHSAVSFWKFTLGTIMEAVTMYLALILSAVILNGGIVNLAGDAAGALYITGWMMQSILICLVTVGSVKGASSLTQRALGL